MYDHWGAKTWDAELDIYGKVRNFDGGAGSYAGSLSDCPFRYQGQYEDEETGLYYNRFRYYDPESGGYLSQDPIGLAGNNPTLYGYVKDVNSWVDEFGLDCIKNKVDGTARENKVRAKLNALFGKDNVLSERTLRNSSGKKVVGADGTGRRIDFIVLDGNGKAKYSVEVTSKTAPKTDQIIKETQIKDAGGTFIRNPNTKEMVDVSNVPTRIIRL